MKYLLLIVSMLFLSACSPKYKVVKEYHAPKNTNSTQTPICLGVCETNRQACTQNCKATLKTCKIKSDRIAKERYAAKMQQYTIQLERYVNEMQLDNFNMYFYHFDHFRYPYYYPSHGYFGYGNSLFWYNPMPFYSYAPKPKKPSLKIEILRAQEEFCDAECGCTQTYDSCYTGCGGEIISKKICIENCP